MTCENYIQFKGQYPQVKGCSTQLRLFTDALSMAILVAQWQY